MGLQMDFFFIPLLLHLLQHTSNFWVERLPLWTVGVEWGGGGVLCISNIYPLLKSKLYDSTASKIVQYHEMDIQTKY